MKNWFPYFIVTVVFQRVLLEFVALLPTGYENVWHTIDAVSLISITIVGTIALYGANGADKGKGFLGKYFAFGFVVGVKIVFLWVLVCVFSYFLGRRGVDLSSATPVFVILEILLACLFYWRVYKHMKDVRGNI